MSYNSTPPPPPPMPPYGYSNPYQQFGPPPNNNLAMAIISTILCCWIFGIPAIVYAAKVDRLWMTGDQAGAYEAARLSKKWSLASIWTAVGILTLYLLFVAGSFLLLANSATSTY